LTYLVFGPRVAESYPIISISSLVLIPILPISPKLTSSSQLIGILYDFQAIELESNTWNFRI